MYRKGLYFFALLLLSGCIVFSGCQNKADDISIPNVVGLMQSEAEAVLTSSTLTVGSFSEEYSDSVPEGQVIQQSPVAGTVVSAGSSVVLIVSKGPELVTVPDVVGFTRSAAESVIKEFGLGIGVVNEEYNDNVPAGKVIRQNPKSGENVVFGSTVALTISKGPELISVPDVVGLTQSAAEAEITDVGLSVGVITQEYSPTIPAGQVISQTPAAGEQIEFNGSVALVVSIGLFDSDQTSFVEPVATESVELEPDFSVEAAKDELLISCHLDITQEQLDDLLGEISKLDCTVLGEAPESRVLQIRIPSTVAEVDIINALSVLPGVIDVSPNMVVDDDVEPDDNYSMFMNYLDKIGLQNYQKLIESPPVKASVAYAKLDPVPDAFAGYYWIDQINAREAWEISTGEDSSVIGIVDSNLGADQTVIDEGRLTRFDWQGNPLENDDHGSLTHGIKVTNLAASDGAIDDDAVGVCWGCDVIFVDWNVGTLGKNLTSALIAAIENISTDHETAVINVSAGPVLGENAKPTNENFLKLRQRWRRSNTNAVITARRNNTLVVFSAGNDGDGTDRNHPISETTVYNDNQLLPDVEDELKYNWLSNALIVAATTSHALDEEAPIDGENAKMADFSRRGGVVNIAAPGEDIGFGSGDIGDGTSFSAPLVTGTAGLVNSVNPDLAAIEIRQIILESANPEPLAGASVGSGLLDVHAALEMAETSRSIPLREEAVEIIFEPGETEPITREVQVTLPETSGVRAMDVLFLTDTSGSYGDDIETFKRVAYDILEDLSALADDVQFGVASFADFPIGYYGDASGGDEAFVLDQKITSNNDLVVSAINQLNDPLNYGADGPESQLEALWQATTGQGRDLNDDGDFIDLGEIAPTNVGWRPGSLRIIILATDASFHNSEEEEEYPGAGFTNVLTALNETGTVVIGLDSGYTGGDLQLVCDSTGGLLFELASDSTGMGEAIWEGVNETVQLVDLSLSIIGDPEEFISRSSLETFTAVPPGESRTFTLTFQNNMNIPISDVSYEFRIWVRALGSAILERIPVFVTLKAD